MNRSEKMVSDEQDNFNRKEAMGLTLSVGTESGATRDGRNSCLELCACF